MAGPWEKYQQQGPWTRYAQPTPQQAKTLPGNPTETIGPTSTIDQLTQIKPITSQMSLPEKAETFVGNIGGGGLGVLLHPYDTAKGVVKSLLNPPAALKATYDAANTRPLETLSGGIGQTAALSPVAEFAPKILAPALRSTGEGMQATGAGIINKTVGALKSDFKRGANPGQAYLDAGGGPALSMQSLANKGTALKGEVGSKIGSAVKSATQSGKTIPAQAVMAKMAPAIQSGVDLELGPGGMKNVQPIQDYASSFTPAFDTAAENGGFTPSQLFDLKTRIAKGTSWSEPSQLNLKAIRQQNAGALGGLLSDEIPELKPLNSQYQGLMNFSKRAATRADTHSVPLTSLAAKAGLSLAGTGTGAILGHPVLGAATGLIADSVPFKTTAASGLYQAGRGLTSLGNGLVPVPRLYPSAIAIPAYNLSNKAKKQDSEDGN